MTEDRNLISRRQMLKTTSCGFGYLAFTAMAAESARAEAVYRDPLASRAPHIRPRAKRVIFLYMEGGPSQIDTCDYKPELKRLAGKTIEFTWSIGCDFENGKLQRLRVFFNPMVILEQLGVLNAED